MVYVLLVHLSFLSGISPVLLLLINKVDYRLYKSYFGVIFLCAIVGLYNYIFPFILKINPMGSFKFQMVFYLLSFLSVYTLYKKTPFKKPKYFFPFVTILFFTCFVVAIFYQRTNKGLNYNVMQNFVMGLFVMIATYYWLKQWLTTIAPIPLLKAPGAFFILASFVFSLACLFPSTFIAPAFLCYKRVNLACHLGQIDAIVCGTLISFGVWKLK